MKVDILDAHDRHQHFTHQDSGIEDYCQKIIDSRPFGNHAFYIFAHTRTIALDEKMSEFNQDLHAHYANPKYKRRYQSIDQVPEKRLIWQPRLTKPTVQTNSMLFKAYPGSDNIKIIWMIPAREMWDSYRKGNVAEHETTLWSIDMFMNNKTELEAKEDDDLQDWQIDDIYRTLSIDAQLRKYRNE